VRKELHRHKRKIFSVLKKDDDRWDVEGGAIYTEEKNYYTQGKRYQTRKEDSPTTKKSTKMASVFVPDLLYTEVKKENTTEGSVEVGSFLHYYIKKENN